MSMVFWLGDCASRHLTFIYLQLSSICDMAIDKIRSDSRDWYWRNVCTEVREDEAREVFNSTYFVKFMSFEGLEARVYLLLRLRNWNFNYGSFKAQRFAICINILKCRCTYRLRPQTNPLHTQDNPERFVGRSAFTRPFLPKNTRSERNEAH